MSKHNFLNQYLLAVTSNLLSFSAGTSCGWCGPNFLLLTQDSTPLPAGPLTVAEGSLVVSLLAVGALIGTIVFSLSLERCGRKILLAFMAIAQIMSWLLIMVATNVNFLYLSRLLAGVGAGGSLVVIPVYVSEIAHDKVRGTLGSLLVLSCNAGILFAFLVADCVGYFAQLKIHLAVAIVYLVVFNFFPESPEYFMKLNNPELARKSKHFYKLSSLPAANGNEAPEKQPLDMKFAEDSFTEKRPDKMVEQFEEEPIGVDLTPIAMADFVEPAAKKGTIIILTLVFLNQTNGIWVILNYTNKIFKDFGSAMSENQASIIVALVQLIANFVAMICVDLAGRKILIVISCFGAAVGFVCMALYDFYKESLQAYNWMSVASFSFVILAASIGMIPLVYVLMTEMLPKKIKNTINLFGLMTLWISSFVLVRFYPLLSEQLGMYSVMCMFAVSCIIMATFTLIMVPETKGKSHEAIMEMLRK